MPGSKHFDGYSYKIITLGCPVNQSESVSLATAMNKAGFKKQQKKADVYIINSCAVTKAAARKSRSEIRQAKKENPSALVVLAGCYGQIDTEEVKSIVPEADIIMGTRGRSHLPQIILEALKSPGLKKQVLVKNLHCDEEYEEIELNSSFPRRRPVVKIQEGCNEFCTYCAIVFARGKPRSRDPRRVVEEVSRLAAAGYREIVLAGTHLGIYGKDLKDTNLPELLKRLDALEYPFRLRLSSLEPMGVAKDLFKVMAESSRICHHLYLPLQSGSSRILKKMGRPYTVEQFSEMVQQARALMPDISIISDIIVGFPGEKEEDHIQSMEAIEQIKLSGLHVFPYSPRPKTPAARFPEQVRPDIKKCRVEEMKALGERLSLDYNRRFIGRKLNVLVERLFKQKDLEGEGFSDNYILTRFSYNGPEIVENKFISVEPRKAFPWGVEANSPI